MSLNHREIDAVLAELSLPGEKIQRILQPSYDTLVFELFSRGRPTFLLASVSSSACRIHGLDKEPSRNERPLRFMECLRSRIRGGVIESAYQIGDQRIVKLGISVYADGPEAFSAERPAERPTVKYSLYFRLWSGAGNIILVDGEGMIVDALLRKPDRGEIGGKPCMLEDKLPERTTKEYVVRDFPGDGSLSQRISLFYSANAGEMSRDQLLRRAQERFEKRMALLDTRREGLEAKLRDFDNRDRLKEIGDILMGMQGTQASGRLGGKASYVEAEDFYRGGLVAIRIDPVLSMVENAQAYYAKAKKADSGYEDVKGELQKTLAAKEDLRRWMSRLEGEEDPFAMAKMLERGGTVRREEKKKFPCLSLEIRGWTILVGRSAKENDEVLRHHVRGSDHWLHARDYAGSYVFVKSRKGKTFPLDILLDAAMLALYYSKARKDSQGDVYHTDVKYLKRVKDGPKGLVIPMLEKNLRCEIEEGKIKALLEGSEGENP